MISDVQSENIDVGSNLRNQLTVSIRSVDEKNNQSSN